MKNPHHNPYARSRAAPTTPASYGGPQQQQQPRPYLAPSTTTTTTTITLPSRQYENNLQDGTHANASTTLKAQQQQQQQHACLYTRHKTQKRKVWHDGRLVLTASSGRAQLFAASTVGAAVLSPLDEWECPAAMIAAIRSSGGGGGVGAASSLESEKYLLQVEGPWVDAPPPAQSTTSTPSTSTTRSTPVLFSQGMQKVLARKFQKPARYIPPPLSQPRPSKLQSILGHRQRPLQPGEWERIHYGSTTNSSTATTDSHPGTFGLDSSRMPPTTTQLRIPVMRPGATEQSTTTAPPATAAPRGETRGAGSLAVAVGDHGSSYRHHHITHNPPPPRLAPDATTAACSSSSSNSYYTTPPSSTSMAGRTTTATRTTATAQQPLASHHDNTATTTSRWVTNEFCAQGFYGLDEEDEEEESRQTFEGPSAFFVSNHDGNHEREDYYDKEDSLLEAARGQPAAETDPPPTVATTSSPLPQQQLPTRTLPIGQELDVSSSSQHCSSTAAASPPPSRRTTQELMALFGAAELPPPTTVTSPRLQFRLASPTTSSSSASSSDAEE